VVVATADPKKNSTAQSYQYSRPVSIRSWRANVAEALYDAGMDTVADRWLTCSQKSFTRLRPLADSVLPAGAEKIYVCTADHHHEAEVYSQTCDLRICPDCARRHSARLVARYLPKMQELLHQHHRTFRFRHIIFTSPYALTDADIQQKYQDGFKQVEKTMAGLMRQKHPDWKAEQGFLVTAEFGEEGKKLHYHVIHYGQYLNQVDLSRAWKLNTNGAAAVVFVRGFPYQGMTTEETLREVLKYATKFYSQDEATGAIQAIPAEQMAMLARTLEKTRRIRSYGVFFGLPEPERPAHSCELCNSPMLGIPVGYWSTYCLTGFLPREWTEEQPALNLKPADKSSRFTSGAPPPDALKPDKRQKSFEQIERMRKKDDWT